MNRPTRVLLGVAGLSGVFAVGLAIAGWVLRSELALAQAADSFVDFAGAFVLTWVVYVAQQPRDEKHPGGHARAEPLGAFVIAILAGVLAVQVTLGAIEALLNDVQVRPAVTLLWLFLGKVVFKGTVVLFTRGSSSPALRALSVDAQNDLLVGAVSVAGFIGIRAGFADLDAWLALPVAAWIGWSGLNLARENIDLLMGVAPSPERQAELLALATRIPGVLDSHALRAHSLGACFAVHIHVSVQSDITVQQAHDIGEAVRALIEAEDDVSECSVHIDPATP